MSTNIILIAQTKSEAIIEILLLLLLAAIIGYLTSWLYYKSIYKRRIMDLKSEKHDFNNRIINLSGDISNLNDSLGAKSLEIEYLKMDLNALKALHREAVSKNKAMELKNRNAQQLYNKNDEALTQYFHERYLLDRVISETSGIAEKDDLKMISGIGPLIEGRLNALEIFTFRQISKLTPLDIELINEAVMYFSGRIEEDEWIAQAKELLISEEIRVELLEKIKRRKALIEYNRIGVSKMEEADDLTMISGIGGWIKEKLNALEIFTFKQISKLTKEDVKTLTEAIEYFPGRIERDEWIPQASELVREAGRKSEILKSIEKMKEKIHFDTIGSAYLHQANNLTLINGIGLWSEEKLNILGIYTFEQISRLSPSDVETIAEILNISPDRINKHKWMNQANKLATAVR